MSNAKHICPLINILINTYKSKEAKQPLPDSSCDEINPSAYTCGRLFACAMQKVAFVVSICFLLGVCENSIPFSNEKDNTSRSEEKKNEFGEIDSWEKGDCAFFVMNGVLVSIKEGGTI